MGEQQAMNSERDHAAKNGAGAKDKEDFIFFHLLFPPLSQMLSSLSKPHSPTPDPFVHPSGSVDRNLVAPPQPTHPADNL